MEKLSADALRLALVTASMEYYKKYVEGNQDFDNSEQIKEELGKLEAAGLGGTKNAETLRTILESKKYKSALGPEKLDLKKVNEITSWIKESYPDALVVTYEDFFAILKKYNLYCGPISTFSGFIPSENVSQIAKASNALNSLNLNYVSWVEAVRIDSRMSKDMTKRLFVKDDKTIEEVSISSEMIPFPTDIVVLEAGKFTVESREYDILDGTCTVILDQQITWTEHPQEYSDAMLAYRKRWNNTIDLSCEDFFKMKQFVQTGSKLQAVKHVKESAKCGLKEAKDFVDTYCDYVL